MSKQESNISAIDETHRRVSIRLQELCEKQSIKPLRALFTTELNYDYSDIRLNLPDEKSSELVYANEDPRIIATGGNGDFKIIYIRLRKALSRVNERTLIARLLPNYLYALFIFADAEQRQWHFVHVKEGTCAIKSRLLRRITIGRDEQLRTATERISLLDLSIFNSYTISTHSACSIQGLFERAFDVEAVAQAFFRDYRICFDILQKDLYKQTGDETWAHDYALQLLNRCMFLYFIQRKHWLGGDTEFLKTFWDAYNKTGHEQDTFVSLWLNTLFFKAFNNKYDVMDNHFPPRIHTVLMHIPFLDSSLLLENALDNREGFVVSDVRFTDIFTLLQRYSFTLVEDSPLDQEVAVDPEMIGTVYESLVNVSTEIDERSGAGIFYTPRIEINLMCRLTLVDYLTNHLDNHPGNERKHLLYAAVFAIEQEDKDSADQHLKDADLWQEIYDLLNNITMIDPACGSGAFLVGMLSVLDDMMERAIKARGLEIPYDLYNAYERKKRIIEQSLYGIDVMEWAVHIAELRLWLALIVDAAYTPESLHTRTEPLLPDITFKVRCGDSLVQGSPFSEIFTDGRGFDIVLGNPPYLRQENIHMPHLKDYSKEGKIAYKYKIAQKMYELFPRFFGYSDRHGKQVVTNPINQKSDLYIYFFFLGLSLLNDKGTFCFITSNSWLDVGYGADLQKFLLKHCHIKLILDSETMRSFASASVNTVIAHLAPPDEESEWGLQETARFVMSKVPFENLLMPEVFEDIESAQSRQTRTHYRVFPIKQYALLEDGKVSFTERGDERDEPIGRKSKKAHGMSATELSYTGNRWGGKYLRAPDIYWTIIEKGKDRLVHLGDIAQVSFGIKTGANKFFYFDSQKSSAWAVEERFLKSVMQSPRECRSFVIDAQALKLKIFVCHESEQNLQGTAAINYIKWGETQGFHRGPSCANRARWWDVGVQSPFDFVALRFRDKRNWNPINITPALLAGDVMFAGTWKKRADVFVNNALANTTLCVLASEVYGRVNLGDGLLTTYGPEIVSFDFVKASLFGAEARQHLLHCFEVMAMRDVKAIFDEVQQEDRKMLDNIVFDVLGLTQGERDAVYESVIKLVNSAP